MTVDDYPQVGSGWAFPPRWEIKTGRAGLADGPAWVHTNDGVPHLEEALVLHLRTALGDRVMRPALAPALTATCLRRAPPTSATAWPTTCAVRWCWASRG